MTQKIKGKDMRLKINGNYLQGGTDCEMTVKAVTADVATKNDPGGGLWDHPAFSHCEFSFSKQSFMCNWTQVQYLLNDAINQESSLRCLLGFKTATGNYSAQFDGHAYITQLKIDAANGEKVKVSISLEGTGALKLNYDTPNFDTAELSAFEGRTLMLFEDSGNEYHSFAFATSHSLTVNVQLSDSSDKDYPNEKEITGKNVVITSDNICSISDQEQIVNAANDWDRMVYSARNGGILSLVFAYVAAAENLETKKSEWEPSADILEGKFLCTNVSTKAGVKGFATYSAEFTSVGQVALKMSATPPSRVSKVASGAKLATIQDESGEKESSTQGEGQEQNSEQP